MKHFKELIIKHICLYETVKTFLPFNTAVFSTIKVSIVFLILLKVAQCYTAIKIEAFSRALCILDDQTNILLLLYETLKTVGPFNVANFFNITNLGCSSDLIKSCAMFHDTNNWSIFKSLELFGLSIKHYSSLWT